MSNGRNKKKPTGFEKAALALTEGLSDEAANGLTSMVRDVAKDYGHNDALMVRRLKARLKNAARSQGSWAREVVARMESPQSVAGS